MQINAKLDFDLVAVESEDTVHALLELTAPAPDTPSSARPPRSRSSSTAAARWPTAGSSPRSRRSTP